MFLTGEPDSPEFEALVSVIRQLYMPDLVLALAESSSCSEQARNLATAQNGKVAAYVCKNKTCSLPVHSLDELAALLNKTTIA